MKRLILFLLTGILTTSVFGQFNKFGVGVECGPTVTSLYGNKSILKTYCSFVSYSTGLSFKYYFNELYSIRTDILYERIGAGTDGIFNNTTIDSPDAPEYADKFDYLNLPILFRINSTNKNFLFYINSGVFISYLLKETYHYYNWGSTGHEKYDNTNLYKKFDCGISAGVGFSIPVIKDKFYLSVEIRDNLGLYNVNKIPAIDYGSIMTNSTNLLIGFGTNLTREKKK